MSIDELMMNSYVNTGMFRINRWVNNQVGGFEEHFRTEERTESTAGTKNKLATYSEKR